MPRVELVARHVLRGSRWPSGKLFPWSWKPGWSWATRPSPWHPGLAAGRDLKAMRGRLWSPWTTRGQGPRGLWPPWPAAPPPAQEVLDRPAQGGPVCRRLTASSRTRARAAGFCSLRARTGPVTASARAVKACPSCRSLRSSDSDAVGHCAPPVRGREYQHKPSSHALSTPLGAADRVDRPCGFG